MQDTTKMPKEMATLLALHAVSEIFARKGLNLETEAFKKWQEETASAVGYGEGELFSRYFKSFVTIFVVGAIAIKVRNHSGTSLLIINKVPLPAGLPATQHFGRIALAILIKMFSMQEITDALRSFPADEKKRSDFFRDHVLPALG